MDWREKTEDERTSQNRLLALAMDGVLEAILITDAETGEGVGPRILHVNTAFLNLLGYTADEILGTTPALFQGLLIDPETTTRLREAMSRWETYSGEAVICAKDGRRLRAELNARPVNEGSGWYTNWVITLRDITERYRREQELHESMQRYRALIALNSIGTFHTDPQSNTTFICESLQRDYPLPPSGDWHDLVHPEDLEIADGIASELAKANGTPYDVTYRMLHRDGSYHWQRVRALPVSGEDGMIREWIGTISDVTEEREQEEARRRNAEWLAYALEASEDGVYDWDFQADRLTVSPRFLELLGLDPNSPANTAYHWGDFVHPDDFHEILDLSRQLRTGHLQIIRQEFRAIHADGMFRWLLHRGTVVDRTKDGKPLRIVGTIADSTDRKDLEQQLVELLENAVERADRDPLTGLFNHGAFHRLLEDRVRTATEKGNSFAVAVMDVNHFKFFNDAYGHAVGDEVLKRIAEALEDARRSEDILGRVGGDEFAMIFPDVLPADHDDVQKHLEELSNVVGYRPPDYEYEIPLTLPFGIAYFPEDAHNAHDLLELADERLRRSKQDSTAGLTESLREKLVNRARDFALLDALVTAVDNKDRYTRRHSEDVLLYCLMISQELGMDSDQRATMMVASLVHDVGKIGVPDRILRRPGRLSARDVLAMQQHVTLGAILVGAVKGLEDTVDAVKHHHERWDGSGYPDRLAGEAIPLTARIMAVADAFSAMTTDRPYRRGMEFERALTVLETGAGIQWDTTCVQALCNAIRAGMNNDGILNEARCTLDALE